MRILPARAKPEALAALRKAWDAGFKDADWARKDPDLSLFMATPSSSSSTRPKAQFKGFPPGAVSSSLGRGKFGLEALYFRLQIHNSLLFGIETRFSRHVAGVISLGMIGWTGRGQIRSAGFAVPVRAYRFSAESSHPPGESQAIVSLFFRDSIFSSSTTSVTLSDESGWLCATGGAPTFKPEEPDLKPFRSTSPSEITAGF